MRDPANLKPLLCGRIPADNSKRKGRENMGVDRTSRVMLAHFFFPALSGRGLWGDRGVSVVGTNAGHAGLEGSIMGNWLLDKKRWRKIGHNSTRTLIHSSTQSPGLRREPPFGDQVRLPRTNTIPWTSRRGIEAAPARIANLTSHESEGMQKSTVRSDRPPRLA